MKKRVISFLLAAVMVLGCVCQILPTQTVRAAVAPEVEADPSTADSWKNMMGDTSDGTRYAGRVWADKSVFENGEEVTLHQEGDETFTFTVDLDQDNGEYFQAIFSALGSSLSTNTTITANRPLDVVIVLDTSTSMNFETDTIDPVDRHTWVRMEHMIPAANQLLDDLLELGDVRIAIVTYNANSETVIELDKYENGINLSVDSYLYNDDPSWNETPGGIVTATDDSGRELGSDSGYESGTNLQSGIDRGMSILANATGTEGRTPVAIILTDGEANRAVSSNWYNLAAGTVPRLYSMDEGVTLSTLLNAAYNKVRVENNYGTDMSVYGIGVDLETGSEAHALMNPGDSEVGFNSSNDNEDIRQAYSYFQRWSAGNTVTFQISGFGSRVNWVFDHNLPSSSGVTSAEVAENINYVDNYQNVSSASLGEAFESIFEELATGAFNPITDTTTGSTGVKNTPLIYADTIGKHMQVKQIQAVHLYGQVYNVTDNGDGTYTVADGSGVNPTTGENWTTEDIDIQVVTLEDGSQQLRVYLNQEILPILLDKLTVVTENGQTTRTLETVEHSPLRVYYTLGIDESVLLPGGQVDLTKLDPDYAYVNSDGTVDFYANAFGSMNTEDRDGDGLVDLGDAHMGFVPSHNNRYYYHQSCPQVYTDAARKDGTAIQWGADGYSTDWSEDDFDMEAMTYADVASINDATVVYTTITFNRPTGVGNNAEEVTRLIQTTWEHLKESVTFYDTVNEAILNGGNPMTTASINSMVSAYMAGKNLENTDLVAVMGLQSQRVTRLQSMFTNKQSNDTQTAEIAYAPAYNAAAHDESDIHEHSEVIVWLGNNGKLTLPAGTGLAVTKELTEVADGASADEKFPISVLLDVNSATGLTFTDGQGNTLTPTVSAQGSKLQVTAELADGQSLYIMGLPGDMDYTVTEAENDNYSYTYTGASKTVTGTITRGIVTNEPIKSGSLYITKEVQHAHGGDSFPVDQEFTFQVTFVDKDGQPIDNTVFDLDNNYDPTIEDRTTDENGVMTGWLRHGETVHIKDIPAGATVTVEEVQIPDGYTLTGYRSRNYSGGEADSDNQVTIVPGYNATVVVTNTYTPDKVSVDLSFDGTKNFDATNMTEDSDFTFKLQEYVDGKWKDVEGEVVTITGGTNATEPFQFDALHLEFDKVGTYSYQIVEELGDNSDITYDRSVYTFSVNVTMDSKGDLQAEVVGYNQAPGLFEVTGDPDNGYLVTTVFNNQYHTTATSVEVIKSIQDQSGSGKTAAGFEIETYNASVDGEGNWTQGSYIRSTVTDAEGEALLVRNYDNTDFETNDTDGDNVVTYHFIFKEKNTGLAGWNYDTTQYRLTVVLTRDASGVITSEFDMVQVDSQNNLTDMPVNGDTVEITFFNKYRPAEAEVSLNTLVKKKLEGRALKDGEFEFAIYKNGETSNPVATGTNAADGTVSFQPKKLTFDKVGKYEYDIIEVNDGLGGVTYDSTIYDLVVEVADNGDGTLKATYYFEDSVDPSVTFKNTYTVLPTEVVIDGIKTLKVLNGSKALRAGDYTFQLCADDGSEVDSTTNLENGTFKFKTLVYTGADAGKTYTYTVRERNGGTTNGGVTYSNQSFVVTVEVIDNGDGTLSTRVTGNGREAIRFENIYDSKLGKVTLEGKKVLEGDRTLKAQEFNFALYQTDKDFKNPALLDDTITHDAAGDFSVTIKDLNLGTYYYTLREVIPDNREPGIRYSGAQYNITVTVTDDGTGEMKAEYYVEHLGVQSNSDTMVFNNLYRAEPGSIGISGTKTYLGGKALEDDVFSVGLYDDAGELLQTALVKADGSFTFEDMSYTADDVGVTYTYTVREIIPEGATDNGNGTMTAGSHIYDASVLTVEITVEDDVKDGVLEISKTVTKDGTAAQLNFTNTYIPDPITHIITAKKTYEKGLVGNDFQFRLQSADGKTDVDETVRNDAEGIVEFSPVTLPAVGQYKFTVSEKQDGILSFIRPSEAEYEVTLTVENIGGVLKVTDMVAVNTKNTNESNLEFVNTYVIDGEDEITLGGTKVLNGGRTMEAGEFSFGLYDAAGTEVERVSVKADGTYQFTTLRFDETDVPMNGYKEITYTVKEIPGTDPLITYDPTVYTVVVKVEDNDEGGVTASYTVNGGDVDMAFTNTYTAPDPVEVNVEILKTVTNKTTKGITPEGFIFELKQGGNVIGSFTSDAQGEAGFMFTLDIDDVGQAYEYTLSEKKGNKKGVTYDKTVYDLKIAVEQNADGSLKTLVNGVETDTASYEFHNIYQEPSVPNTGDEAKLLLLGLLAVAGITGLGATVIFGFRRKEKR